MLSSNLKVPQSEQPAGAGSQPNELDLRRIIRMLRKRARYRYVSVKVIAAVE